MGCHLLFFKRGTTHALPDIIEGPIAFLALTRPGAIKRHHLRESRRRHAREFHSSSGLVSCSRDRFQCSRAGGLLVGEPAASPGPRTECSRHPDRDHERGVLLQHIWNQKWRTAVGNDYAGVIYNSVATNLTGRASLWGRRRPVAWWRQYQPQCEIRGRTWNNGHLPQRAKRDRLGRCCDRRWPAIDGRHIRLLQPELLQEARQSGVWHLSSYCCYRHGRVADILMAIRFKTPQSRARHQSRPMLSLACQHKDRNTTCKPLGISKSRGGT